MEAPDECGHRHEIENKKKSIEVIDTKVVKPIYEALKASGEDFKILIMPDHPTPLAIRTHTHEPVPYMIYDSRKALNGVVTFNEIEAENTGIFVKHGPEIMEKLLEKM